LVGSDRSWKQISAPRRADVGRVGGETISAGGRSKARGRARGTRGGPTVSAARAASLLPVRVVGPANSLLFCRHAAGRWGQIGQCVLGPDWQPCVLTLALGAMARSGGGTTARMVPGRPLPLPGQEFFHLSFSCGVVLLPIAWGWVLYPLTQARLAVPVGCPRRPAWQRSVRCWLRRGRFRPFARGLCRGLSRGRLRYTFSELGWSGAGRSTFHVGPGEARRPGPRAPRPGTSVRGPMWSRWAANGRLRSGFALGQTVRTIVLHLQPGRLRGHEPGR